jgi:protease I
MNFAVSIDVIKTSMETKPYLVVVTSSAKERVMELEGKVMELEGKHVAVLVEDNYADLELWYPALRLQETGAEVIIVGSEARRYTSRHGLPIQADICVEQVSADDFDAIVVPGRAAPDAMRSDPAIMSLLHDMEEGGKVVATISYANQTLSSARDADDEESTRFMDLNMRIRQQDGAFAESTVLREGNVITAGAPVNLLAFCRMIIVAMMAAASSPSAHLKNYG